MATASAARVLSSEFSPVELNPRQRSLEAQAIIWLTKWLKDTGHVMAGKIARRYREVVAKTAATSVAKDDSPSNDEQRQAEEIVDYVGFGSWSSVSDYIYEPIAESATDAGNALLYDFSIDDRGIFDAVSEDAVRWSRERSAELIGKRWVSEQLIDNPNPQWAITETTRDLLRNVVADAIENALGWQDLAYEIKSSYVFSADRAELIARTEIGNAHMWGAQLGAKATGLHVVKTWKIGSTHDIDDECDDNADAGELELDAEFPSGIVAGLAHPRCECRVSYKVVTEES